MLNYLLHFEKLYRDSSIWNSEKDNCIDCNCHCVFRQQLLRWNFKRKCPQVNFLIRINARHYKKQSGTPCSSRFHPSQAEYHSTLVLLNDLQNNLGWVLCKIHDTGNLYTKKNWYWECENCQYIWEDCEYPTAHREVHFLRHCKECLSSLTW